MLVQLVGRLQACRGRARGLRRGRSTLHSPCHRLPRRLRRVSSTRDFDSPSQGKWATTHVDAFTAFGRSVSFTCAPGAAGSARAAGRPDAQEEGTGAHGVRRLTRLAVLPVAAGPAPLDELAVFHELLLRGEMMAFALRHPAAGRRGSGAPAWRAPPCRGAAGGRTARDARYCSRARRVSASASASASSEPKSLDSSPSSPSSSRSRCCCCLTASATAEASCGREGGNVSRPARSRCRRRVQRRGKLRELSCSCCRQAPSRNPPQPVPQRRRA